MSSIKLDRITFKEGEVSIVAKDLVAAVTKGEGRTWLAKVSDSDGKEEASVPFGIRANAISHVLDAVNGTEVGTAAAWLFANPPRPKKTKKRRTP